MSHEVTTWAWKQSPPSSTTLLVLLRLADRARPSGRCYPSQASLAADCHLSPRAVFDALKVLEAEGLITRTRRASSSGRSSDLIQLCLSKVVLFEDGPPDDDEDGETKSASGPDTESASGVGELAAGARTISHDVREPPAPGAKEPVTEPVKRTKQEDGRPAFDFDVLAARVFAACAPMVQERQNGDCFRIMQALKQAAEKGEDANRVADAVIAYVSRADQHKKRGEFGASPSKIIDGGQWTLYVNAKPNGPAPRDLNTALAPITEIEHEGHVYAVPEGGQPDRMGTYALPGVKLQLALLERWETRRLVDWNPEKWGPPPGAPGCRFWPSVLERFKHESVGGQA